MGLIEVPLRDCVASNYSDISRKKMASRTDNLKLAIFVRNKFPKFTLENTMTSIKFDTGIITQLYFYGVEDTLPPEIRGISTHDGLTIGNRQPKIEFELTDGDVTQNQVDLRKLVFTLDGNDLTDDMQVRSHINTSGKYDKKDPRKHTFERLRIWYVPPAPLSPGKHTVYIKAVDSADNASEKAWSFTVK